MTGFLHEEEFSRKAFVKGGGALIVGFSLLGTALSGKAQAADSPYASNGPYDHYQVDSWITINADNTASIKSGAILQGTGSDTGILMIAAEELDMDMSQMIYVDDDTNVTPETGTKAASNTITNAGPGVRAAAAWAKQTLLGLAATQLGVPTAQLAVSKGVVSGGGKSVKYGDLLGGKLFNVRMPASYNMTPRGSNVFDFTGGIQPGQSPAKAISEYKVVGTSPPRIDIPNIVAGTLTYIQNIKVPGMLHGRIVLPRGQALYGFGAPVVSVDESSISHLPGARVVRKKDFIGVVAPHEYDAIQAAAQLKVKWADPPKALPGSGNEFAGLRALDKAGKTIPGNRDLTFRAPNNGNVDQALASAAHVVSASYGWPTNSHNPIGPNCAVADVTKDGARIFSGTQGAYVIRDVVAPLLGLPANKVRVTAVPMGSAYGNSPYEDVAQAAALMSQLAGAPVRVQLMRWDEIGWDNTAPGTAMDIRAGIDAKGNLVGFDFTQVYPQYKDSNIRTVNELVGDKVVPSATSGQFWPATMYNAPNNRYAVKQLPPEGNWIKTAWMRAGSSLHTTFAAEQVIDDLARAANMDPVAFRMQNVAQGDTRGALLAVLSAATKAANWQPKVTGSKLSDANVVTGRGVAWSNVYGANNPSAAVADISVNKKTGKITIKHVYQAFSAGLSVYPGGVENQMVGGMIQALSRLMVEQLRFNTTHQTSLDFVTYPILRFKDSPTVTTMVLQRTDLQPQGVGEPVAVVAPAAVANALFDATGVRLHTAPFTPARVRAALKAAGVA